jgi:hypothetical protein
MHRLKVDTGQIYTVCNKFGVCVLNCNILLGPINDSKCSLTLVPHEKLFLRYLPKVVVATVEKENLECLIYICMSITAHFAFKSKNFNPIHFVEQFLT